MTLTIPSSSPDNNGLLKNAIVATFNLAKQRAGQRSSIAVVASRLCDDAAR